MPYDERKYNITTNIYNAGADVIVEQGCNGYMFTNIGDTIAEVNGMVIFPSATPATALGDSRSVGGNRDEIYKGVIRVRFQAPIGAAPAVEVVQKIYMDKKA